MWPESPSRTATVAIQSVLAGYLDPDPAPLEERKRLLGDDQGALPADIEHAGGDPALAGWRPELDARPVLDDSQAGREPAFQGVRHTD